MLNDFDLPNGLFDKKLTDGPNPDEQNPPPRTSRRYHHLRSLAENGDLEDAFENIDTLAFMRLCMLRLAEKGHWKEAARIAKELAPYLHQRLPNVNVVRHESAALAAAAAAAPHDDPTPPDTDPAPTPPGAPDHTPDPTPPAPPPPPHPRPRGDDPPRTLMEARHTAYAHERAEQRQWWREARWNWAIHQWRERHRRIYDWHLHADPKTFTAPPANDDRPAEMKQSK